MIILALLCSLMSIGFFIYLAIQHVELVIGAHSGESVCNINQHFNCDAVSLSSFSELFGMPIALWGAWAQMMIALLILLYAVGLVSEKERVLRGAAWGSLLTSLISIVMLGISHFVVRSYCLFCMGTYILSWIQTVLLWRRTQFVAHAAEDFPQFLKGQKWIPMTALIGVIFGTFISNAILNQSYDMDKLAPYVQKSFETWQGSKENTFRPETGLILSKAPASSPVTMTIVEFADFECPHCRMAYPSMEAFANSHDDVRLIFKFFPLDGNCNADNAGKGDGSRCVLAKTVYCTQAQGKDGWQMHHFIFDHQEAFFKNPEVMSVLKEKIAEMGLDEKALQACLDSDATHGAILGMTEEGIAAGVDGTPAIYVNGKKVGLGPMFPILDKIHQSLVHQNGQ